MIFNFALGSVNDLYSSEIFLTRFNEKKTKRKKLSSLRKKKKFQVK